MLFWPIRVASLHERPSILEKDGGKKGARPFFVVARARVLPLGSLSARAHFRH